MKFPKNMRKYCPYCKKYTVHKVLEVKKHQASSLSRGSKHRAKKRGLARGFGNLGRYSKRPITQWKQTGAKSSKKIDIRLECSECKKKHIYKHTFRTKKLEIA
ncbi:MAG: 50S ribosomal protein L44e [Candidatus Woesearchaeota archaeon]